MPKYYIDFGCWVISAKDADEAFDIAVIRLEKEDPEICSVDLCSDDDVDTSVDAGFGGDTGKDADRN